ncbi:MAG: MFS transporter [Candidatus Hermodarchaeota archaeon]
MNEKVNGLQNKKKRNLSEQKNFRYLIFGTIYLHQGFIEVFMYIYMALYLISYGVSILYIGLSIGIGTAPWIIKPIYGLLTDRKVSRKWGRRIPYMLVGSFFSAILFFMLIPVNPNTAWVVFLSIIIAANFFNAICDTATDGLVVDSTLPEKRSTAQSVCWGSKFVGYVTAAILLGFMIEIFGWGLYFLFMGLFLLMPIPMLLISREASYEIPEKFPTQDLKDTFKEKVIWIAIFFFILSSAGLYAVLSMLPLFLSLELNLDLSLVGITMSVGYVSFVIGCLVSGPILDRLSRRISLCIPIILLSIISVLFSLTQNFTIALVFMIFAGFSWGILQISVMTLAMDLCKKSISATTYSLYMSILNLGNTIGVIIGAILAEVYGFRLTFVFAALIVLSTLILVFFMKGTEKLFKE